MKYTLKAESDNYSTTVEFEEDSLNEIVENIKLFLLGVGFSNESIPDYFSEAQYEINQ